LLIPVLFLLTSGQARQPAHSSAPTEYSAERSVGHSAALQPADYVNPFIGASTSIAKAGASHGLGKTFPGAATPYGMVQVSPNTITGGDNGPGYSYEHTSIEGFAFTQMSGIGWYGDLGNFLVMPATGALKTSAGRPDHEEEGYRSSYTKSSEQARAGYYDVFLSRYKVRAEMTAAPHSGMLRFTFPQDSRSRIQVDLARRVGGTSTEQYIKIIDDHTVRGWMKCTPDGGGWGNGAGHADYTVYYYAQFSKPLKDYGVWSADIPADWTRKLQDIESRRYQDRVAAAATSGITMRPKEQQGKHLGFFTDFATQAGEQVMMKAGISFASMESAEHNLKAEIADWDFDRVHSNATTLWNQALDKINISGGTEEEKTVFYTALYHTMIDPRDLSDVEGTYPGGDGKVHHSTDYTRRTIFSGWDVFRSQMPLQTIINPSLVNDLIHSLVDLADESGKHYLERWELLNAYSGCMLGNPAVVVMADAYAKGIKGYDLHKAYEYAVNTCERTAASSSRNLSSMISNTLEDDFSEWCLSRLAAALGKKDDESKYLRRSQGYKNIFDTSVHWFRPRLNDGSWVAWPAEGRLRQSYGTVESNPYQQGWFVPHDIPGMVELMGGRDSVIADLLNFFERTPKDMLWNNYYNHANEPVHHVPFLFNRLGAPWLTQEWTRKICARAYHNSVEGLVGNEDVGQMSAWYVLAAAGLHPVCPGDTRYEITSPVFDKIVIRLDPYYSGARRLPVSPRRQGQGPIGNTFTIVAKNNATENLYIQRAFLNGRPYNKCYLDHSDIMAGGALELEMGPRPEKNWGTLKPRLPDGQAEINSPATDTAPRISLPGWAMGPFIRPAGCNPILSPDTTSFYDPMSRRRISWESGDVFNPAAITRQGKVVVLYRAEDRSGDAVIGGHTSRIGMAVSKDGITMKKRTSPVLFPAEDGQKKNEWPGGCEDPRVAVTAEGKYVLLYTQWNRQTPRLAVATSTDLLHWTKYGPAFAKAHGGRFVQEPTKSASILTTIRNGRQVITKINGKYFMYWGEAHVYAAVSSDLVKWEPLLEKDGELRQLISPRPGYFDSQLTECGPPALLTPKGILLFYNGKNRDDEQRDKHYTANAYCAGQVLFDAKDPTKAIARLDKPFLKPEADFEKSGQYPAGTVFIEGMTWFDNKWFLYYGCADSRVSVVIYDPNGHTGSQPVNSK